MSHNVFAVDISPDAYPIWANANPTCSFHHRSSNTWVNNSFSNNSTGTTATSSVDKINCDYPNGLSTKNTYAVYSFRFDNFAYDNSADSGWLATKASQVAGDGKFGVIGQTVSSLGATGWQIDIYLYGEGVSTGGGTFQLYNPLNSEEIFYIKPQERVTFVGASYWRVENQTNYSSILNDIYDRLVSLRNTNNGNQLNILNVVNNIESKLDNLGEDVANNVNNGQADATQDAADNSSISSNNNSSNQTTSNLLGVFGSFVTALTSISPSNCNVDFDLGHIDFGVQNLCSQPVPQVFTVVTSIIVVCFTIPFVVHLVKRILGLIREMQS